MIRHATASAVLTLGCFSIVLIIQFATCHSIGEGLDRNNILSVGGAWTIKARELSKYCPMLRKTRLKENGMDAYYCPSLFGTDTVFLVNSHGFTEYVLQEADDPTPFQKEVWDAVLD